MQIKILSIFKLVSFESLAGNDLSERGTPGGGVRKRKLTAKETSIAVCEIWVEKYGIAVQGIFVGIIIKASGASLKVTDSLFVFAFL